MTALVKVVDQAVGPDGFDIVCMRLTTCVHAILLLKLVTVFVALNSVYMPATSVTSSETGESAERRGSLP